MENLFQLFYTCSGISTDTRSIGLDSLFIALSGENFNGNTFAQEAIQKGAKFAIVDDTTVADNISVFYVPNALQFLQKLANHHRNKFSIPIIGITGSNGKTTSKELISTVLSAKYNVLFTHGNLNNHIGVPLTLLLLNAKHQIAVIEMGANKPGDIAELCEIAEPTHGIITNIGKAHLEGFGDLEGVFKTKIALFESVMKNGGIIIHDIDNELIASGSVGYQNLKTFGTTNKANLIGTLLTMNPYVVFHYQFGDYHSPELHTNMIGQYNFSNFLAAVRFGIEFNMDFETINTAVCSYLPSNNRSEVKKTAHNVLILDAYNANPSSMLSAINSFEMMETEQSKLMILGDMLEMGDSEKEEHQKIIALAQKTGINTIFVGQAFDNVKTPYDSISYCANRIDAELILEHVKFKDKLILLKGSRGIGLEKLIPYL
jgi:UDP-N-acetylmuramoyl-tripeptide--D-alanyl-D-alanine ligase